MARPKGATTVPANETKSEKFKRVGAPRVEKALDAIAALGGLAAPATYEYTAEDWQKIFDALTAEMNKVAEKVKNPTAKSGGRFSF